MKKKVLVVTVCLFCLSGCSTKLAYNFLGFIFNWHIGSYVSLDKSQKSFINTKVEEFHAWHRDTQLEIYAEFMNSLINELKQDEISGQWIHEKTDKLQLLLDDSINQIKPAAIELISSFSDTQADEILENLAKKRNKYKKKYIDISEEKRHKRRRGELLNYIGPFFGKLSDKQKTRIEKWLNGIRPYEALTYEQQTLWAEKFKEALSIRHKKPLLAEKINEIMFYRTDDWNPELQEILDHNQKISYDLIAQLINGKSDRQRKKMFTKLENYRDDFIDLSRTKNPRH